MITILSILTTYLAKLLVLYNLYLSRSLLAGDSKGFLGTRDHSHLHGTRDNFGLF